MPAQRRPWSALLLVLTTACAGSVAQYRSSGPNPPVPSPGQQAAAAKVAPLRARVRPDVFVLARRTLTAREVAKLRALGRGGFTTVRAGTVRVAGLPVRTVAVDPSRFRAFTPKGTAEADAVWQAVARGEAVVSHDVAKRRTLKLGQPVALRLGGTQRVRLGALATTALPDVGLVLSDRAGAALRMKPVSGAVLSSGRGDPAALAAAVRRVVPKAHLHLLSQPTTPYAFLTGSNAARAFGAFSYRYYPDGTIEPDARWVATNIVSTSVPVLGVVTCHRLMIPQLRSALAEVQRSGLAGAIRPGQYGGCYVPRFIESNPSRSISLHTWGIAIDLNVQDNMPGTAGRLDPRVVSIFKRWGFRWGGDWQPTDPMHFELGALLAG